MSNFTSNLRRASFLIATLGILVSAQAETISDLVVRTVEGPAGAYFTYPHSNGFWRSNEKWDRNTFVVARPTGTSTSLIEFDPTTGSEREVAVVRNMNLFYCITHDGRALMVTQTPKRMGNSLVLVDLTGKEPERILYTAADNFQISHGCDIGEDGSTAVFAEWSWSPVRVFKAMKLDVASGAISVVMTPSWLINHVHQSPFDPNWLSVCHEMESGKLPVDRLWACHATLAPQGIQILPTNDAEGRPFFATHERAMFHKPGVIMVVISPSAGEPRGLYEVGFDGTRRVISEGKGFQHCNISRDGRWAVADVASQVDQGIIETVLFNFKTGAHQTLYRGHATQHPWHVHPHFSPDGKWIVFNDSALQRTIAIELDPAKVEARLGGAQ